MGATATPTMESMSSDAQKKIKRAFDLCDKDKDGSVSAQELFRFLQALGHNPTQADLATYPPKSDFNSAWSMHESTMSNCANSDAMRDNFRLLDDGDVPTGKVDWSAIASCLKVFGKKSDAEINQLKQDLHAGAVFDYEEFVKGMAQAEFLNTI